MISGFNTNIRYRGVLFHVQSEDSGRELPHIITHLYHGGTILHSEKSSYSEHLEAANLDAVVKERMETQHKAVLKRLVGNGFDAVIQQRLGPEIFQDSAEPKAQTRSSETEPVAPDEAAAAEPLAGEEVHAFGDGIVSEKPLDEVILNYLVENARGKRKRPSHS